MTRSRNPKWCLLASAGWFWMVAPSVWAAQPSVDALYAVPKVLQLRIEIPPAALEALRKEPRTYVKATLHEGDKLYANVGLRLKGTPSAPQLDKKPSLAIKFSEFESAQSFHGHDKIMLNNSHQDPSYLREAIAGDVFRAIGVPAAKVIFARVELNGRDAGLYLLTQAPNRDFLSDYFKKTKGNFYEANKKDVTEQLRLDSGSGPKEQADLRDLASAARGGDPTQRLKRLATVLDLERFFLFLAAEVITWHRHGYLLERDNYRLYHEPQSDKIVFIPDGLDGTFTKTDGLLLPECKGLVARAVLESPEGQRLYRERVAKLLAGPFRVEVLHNRINELAGTVRPALARDANEVKAFDTAVAQLRETIAQRAKFIEEELKKQAK